MDQILAFWLGDQRLQLRCGEGVDQASLGDDQEQNLGAGQDGKLIGLRDESVPCSTRRSGCVARAMDALLCVEIYLLHDTGLAL